MLALHVPIENSVKTNLVCIDDYQKCSQKTLSKGVYEFFAEGSGQQETLKSNTNAFKKYKIKPRYLCNVAHRNLKIKILGKDISMPIGVAPTAMQKLAHPDGETAIARATQELNTIYIMSIYSTTSIEDVVKAAPHGRKWLQLFIFSDRKINEDVITNAERNGFEAIVVTCDFPVLGIRLASARNKLYLPQHLQLGVLKKYMEQQKMNDIRVISDPSAQWNDIKWLKTITKLPIVAKGILSAEDAILAIEAGVSAIIVSNHGGRQLDSLPTTIEVLPEIVQAVGDKVEVYIDCGFRDGTDVYKAIALGAKMVFVGRPAIWGLAHSGTEGVKNVLNILRNELDVALAISGCCSLDEITPEKVVHESYYSKL
ncbi:2-Hydroxyacid oxidase 1-like [Diorhabda sublineata]|uniref:2-Hydroxyacid oxidase 1-like n=1 Tax=Diorhabda sublineata TaxID=1163346 RepID=UPI0024E05E14|nr:2-Hydroxyacid oxidase 1-like [Diorhabda sublineata]